MSPLSNDPTTTEAMNDARIERMLLSLIPAAPSADLTQRVAEDLCLTGEPSYLDRIERLLRGLRPTAPSAELYDRVSHDFSLADKFRSLEAMPSEVAAPRKPMIQPLTWATFGAAAAIIIMSVMQFAHFHPSRATSVADSAAAKPAIHLTTEIPEITNSREFLKVNDDGININPTGQAQRVMRFKSIERQQWIDPTDGAVYIIETPREHTIAVPVNIQ